MTTTTRTWGAMANNALYGAEVAGQYIEVTLPYSESSLGSRAERLAGGDETYLCYFVNRKYSDKQALLDILHSLNGNKS